MDTMQRITPETVRSAWLVPDPSAGVAGTACGVSLMLDPEDGTLWPIHRHQSDNAIDAREYHGRWVRLSLYGTDEGERVDLHPDPVALTMAINAGAADALIARIVDGYNTIWDGNNHVGAYTADARAAINELQTWIDGCDRLPETAGVWDARDWLGNDAHELGISVETTDDDVDRIASEWEQIARDEQCVVLDDAYQHLAELQAALLA